MKALVTLLVVLVSLVLPATASAFTAIGAGTCTGGLDVAGSAFVGVLGLVGPEKHRGNVHQYGETASGSSNAARGASTVLNRTPQALQKFFTKHGADFGLKGNWNPSRAADASRVPHQHVNNPAVRAIEGTYRGNPVTHYVDPQTGLNVIAGPGGNFVSGWRLGAEQLEGVLTTGRLF